MNWASFIMCTWPSEDSAVIYNNVSLLNLHSYYKKISLFLPPVLVNAQCEGDLYLQITKISCG